MAGGMKNKAWEPKHGEGNLCPNTNTVFTAPAAQPEATLITWHTTFRGSWEDAQ